MFENEILWLIIAFLVVVLVAFTGVYWFLESRRKARERVAPPKSSPDLGSAPEFVLGGVTPALATQIPMTEGARTELQRDLLRAGFYRQTALVDYTAVRNILTLLPLMVALVLCLLVEQGQIVNVFVGGLIAAALGFSLPRIYVTMKGRIRSRHIQRGLPAAIDMLTLCLTAGQNPQNSLLRVSQELRHSFPDLSNEFLIAAQQTELRSLSFAMNQMADRVQVPDVQNLAVVLAQAERLGTDTASALLEYSTSLRTTMRQNADAAANRASFWLLFPSVLCLFIPAAIILVAPALLQLRDVQGLTIQKDLRLLHEQFRGVGPVNVQPPLPPPERVPPSDRTPAEGSIFN